MESYLSLEVETLFISEMKRLGGIDYTENATEILNEHKLSFNLTKTFFNMLDNKANIMEDQTKLLGNSENQFSSGNSSLTQLQGIPSNEGLISFLILGKDKLPKIESIDNYIMPEIKQRLLQFEGFYKEKFSGRKLEWNYLYSTITFEAVFSTGKYLITGNFIQSALLFVLDKHKEMTFTEIQQYFGEMSKLSGILEPLSAIGIVKQESKDKMSINPDFAYSRKIIRLQKRQNKAEMVEKEKVEKERENAVDCIIVRAMKRFRQIEHKPLVAEVHSQLERFKVSNNTIKSRIENLLTRRIISRSEEDGSTYFYAD